MKKLNAYFFEQSEISKSDSAWFYGGIIVMVTIFALTLISIS